MSSEATLPYDGPLSTYTEWDVFLYGLVVGVALSIKRVCEDIRAEPSKLIAGAIVGYALVRWRRR
ncbi:MAG: hypothetical protein ACOCY1_04705 [Halovenus sp.]